MICIGASHRSKVAWKEAKGEPAMIRKATWLLAGGVCASLSLSSCNTSADDNYEICLQNASKANTAVGVNTATVACNMKYQREGQQQRIEQLKNQSGTISNVYWDGWSFKTGTLPDGFKNRGYRIYTLARYGVVTCEAAMPEEMGNQIGNAGDQIDTRNNPQHHRLWQACFEAR